MFRVRRLRILLALALIACGGGCRLLQAAEVRITLLHLGDLSEIERSGSEPLGGLSRVATLRRKLLQENPNTITLLSGDALSPSGIGRAVVEGDELSGRPMVAVLNALGLDFATFGNHEFDLERDQFLSRLKESTFTWISSNVSDRFGNPLPGTPRHLVLSVAGEGGVCIKVGLIGVTVRSHQPGYVAIGDPIGSARAEAERLRGACDVVIALTHQPLDADRRLAEAVPEIRMILGGHDHQNHYEVRASALGRTLVAKGDANARTAYVHRLCFDTTRRRLQVRSRLVPIDGTYEDDLRTRRIASHWSRRGREALRREVLREGLGRGPEEVVARTCVALDGRDASTRTGPTNFTTLVARGFLAQDPDADLSLFNSGSIRLDDLIPPGPIRIYDVYRALPYSGQVVHVEMTGALLRRLLDRGRSVPGSGAFLQWENVARAEDNGTWSIRNRPLEPGATYRVATTDYLAGGKEADFDQDGINRDLRRLPRKCLGDIRATLISYLRAASPIRPSTPTDAPSPVKESVHLESESAVDLGPAGPDPRSAP